jgi:hypothetical protein
MTRIATRPWESKRTAETRSVEDALRKAGFAQVDAYRYNVATIRVRVVDPRFEGLTADERDDLVEPHLERLPEETQSEITTLLTFAPSELRKGPKSLRESFLNKEFEEPSPSIL